MIPVSTSQEATSKTHTEDYLALTKILVFVALTGYRLAIGSARYATICRSPLQSAQNKALDDVGALWDEGRMLQETFAMFRFWLWLFDQTNPGCRHRYLGLCTTLTPPPARTKEFSVLSSRQL
jgi:hypothetical protein